MKFIVTDELGRLAKWLRILGFDTFLEKDRAGLVMRSLREERIIVTRDSKLSRFTGTRMVRIDSDFVEEQMGQLIKTLDLKIDRDKLFSMCIVCNEPLAVVEKDSVKSEVPEYVFRTQADFTRCPRCGKIYWQGTHWTLVNKLLNRLEGEKGGGGI